MGFMRITAKGVVPKFVMRRGVLRVQETSGLEKQERKESKAGRARTVRERDVESTARRDLKEKRERDREISTTVNHRTFLAPLPPYPSLARSAAFLSASRSAMSCLAGESDLDAARGGEAKNSSDVFEGGRDECG